MKVFVGIIFGLISLTSYAEVPSDALKTSVEKRVENATKDDNSAFMHGMRGSGESVEAAREKINAWIRYNFQIAFAAKAKGDNETALFHYFMARHALRDSTSPTSNDEHGDPAILKKTAEHRDFPNRSWRDKVDEDTQLMFENNFVPSGDLLKMYGIDSEKGPIDRPNQLPRPKIGKR